MRIVDLNLKFSMELELIRSYHPNGTNGTIYYKGKLQCNCIELPWLNNQHQVSCIPEGRYELEKIYNEKFKWHFIVKNVPGREAILVHPANSALKELKGCIAPVSKITGEGLGIHSKDALMKLFMITDSVPEKETIFLNIKSN